MIYSNILVTLHLKMATRLVVAGRWTEKRHHSTFVCLCIISSSMQLHFQKLFYVDILAKVSSVVNVKGTDPLMIACEKQLNENTESTRSSIKNTIHRTGHSCSLAVM